MIRASFAVVGHPNKGKSSIVSTLSRNDSVEVSRRSGTTKKAYYYRIDTGKAGFELIDTPGFQRPKRVLHWLQKKSQSADQRLDAIKAFIQSSECQKSFPDEVELLTPIVKGAAILYVVDASRPYSKEYETEMEILRWTGKPSMALINPIENEDYVANWEAALNQYFKTVRVFNPIQSNQIQQLELLEAFAHLEPKWRQSIYQVIEDLRHQQEARLDQSAEILVALLVDLCSYQMEQKVLTQSQAEKLKASIEKGFESWMIQRELKAYKSLASLYSHHSSELDIDKLEMPPNLFDSEKWFAWGLSKKELAAASLITGAVGCAAIDAMLAGHSFFLGSLIGGAIGFSSAWFGADKVSDFKVKGIPLGGYKAIQGPIKNPNFPYVIIGRFLYILDQIRFKNHADRSKISLKDESQLQTKVENILSGLSKQETKELHQACYRLISQKPVQSLLRIIRKLLV